MATPTPPQYVVPNDHTNQTYLQLLANARRYGAQQQVSLNEPSPGLQQTQYGIGMGAPVQIPNQPTVHAQDWDRLTPDAIATRQIGYAPSFWQDPQRVARYYNVLQMAPKGWQPPDWLNPQAVTDAYKYFEYRNQGTPWTQWKNLPLGDPGLDLLAGMKMPPNEFLQPNDYPLANNTLGQVVGGQAPWGTLAPEVREKLLADPGFDIMDYDATTRNDIMADPSFDWSKLPWWQKYAHDALSQPVVAGIIQSLPMAAVAGITTGGPGAIPVLALGAAGGLAQSSKNEWVQKIGGGILGALGFPSQAVEQAGGLAAQVFNSLTDPEKYGDISDVLGNWDKIKAGYQAARGGLEGAALVPEVVGDPLQMLTALSQAIQALMKGGLTEEKARQIIEANPVSFMHYATGKGGGLVPQFDIGGGNVWQLGAGQPQKAPEINQLMADTRDAIVNGADPVQTVNNTILQYGLTGTERDLMVKMVVDPLNYLPGVTNRGLANEISGKTLVGQTLLGKAVENAFGPAAETALQDTRGLTEAGRRYSSIVKTTMIGETAAEAADAAAGMSGISRLVAGITDKGEIRAGPFTNQGLMEKPVEVKGVKGFINYMSTLTPEARAITGLRMANENLRAILFQFKDPVESAKFLSAIAQGDLETAASMSRALVGTPEFYTILPMMREFINKRMPDLLAIVDNDVWRERTGILYKMADVLGMEPANLLDNLETTHDATRTFETFKQKLSQLPDDPVARSFLEDIQGGLFTAEDIQSVTKMFTGKSKLPWNVDLWNATVAAALDDHYSEWAKTFFDLKPDSLFFQAAHALKSAQSIMLMGGNPAYAIRNTLNDIMTRYAAGVGGFMTGKQKSAWMDAFELEPSRYREGIGMTGEAATAGVEGATASMIRETRMGNGAISKLDRAIRKVGNVMPFTKASGWVEGMEGSTAFVIGMRKIFPRIWRRGVGFKRMDPELTRMLTDIDPNLPNTIYSAFEAGMNQRDIEASLLGQQTAQKARSLIHDAAKNAGQDVRMAASMLDQLGVIDRLDVNLKAAGTNNTRIDAAFREVSKFARDQMDSAKGRQLRARMADVQNRIQVEGPASAMDLLAETMTAKTDAMLRHYDAFGDVFEQLENVADPAMRQNLIDEAYRQSDADFRRTHADTMATYKGMVDAMGWKDIPEVNGFLASLDEINRLESETYNFMRDERARIFEKYQGDYKNPAMWDEIKAANAQVDQKFTAMFKGEHMKMLEAGESMRAHFEKTYGLFVGTVFDEGWKKIVAFRDEMVVREQAFREQIKQAKANGADSAAIRKLKADYYQKTKMGAINEFAHVRQEFGENLQAAILGRNPPDRPQAGPTATQPVEPVQPPAQPVPGRGGAARPEQARPEQAQPELLTQEAATQVAVQDAIVTDHTNAVFAEASKYGFASADPEGRPYPDAKLDLIKLVKHFGGEKGRYVRRFSDLTPDLVGKAFINQHTHEMAQELLMANRPVMPVGWEGEVESAIKRGNLTPEMSQKLRDIPASARTEREQAAIDMSLQKAEHLAYTDLKMGIKNRNAYETELAAGQLPPVTVYFDLDYFKTANDAGSELLGDEILVHYAGVVRDAVPEQYSSNVYRWGGDDVVACVGTPEEATAAVNRARELARGYQIKVNYLDPQTRLPILKDGQPQMVTIDGLRFQTGIGRNFSEAEANLKLAKQRPGAAKRAGYPEDATIEIAPDGWKPVFARTDAGLTPTDVSQRGGGENPAGIGAGETGAAATAPVAIDWDGLHREHARLSLIGQPEENLPLGPNGRVQEFNPLTFQTFEERYQALGKPLRDAFGEMQRQAGESPAKSPESVLVAIKKAGGIDLGERMDIAGDKVGNMPGLFRKGGMPVDDLATWLREHNYILQDVLDNPSDNGGINAVRGLVRDAIGGKKVHPLGEMEPAWVKRAGGAENANRLLGQILAGVEDPKAKRVQAIKSDAWDWVQDNIHNYDDARQYLKLPFNEAESGLVKQIHSLADQVAGTASLAEANQLMENVSDIFGRLPEDMPDPVIQELSDLQDRVNERRSQFAMQDEAEATTQAAEARSEMIMTKDILREKLQEEMGLPEDQANGVVDLTDARANAWAKVNGRTPEEWYQTHIAEVVRGGEGELNQAEGGFERALSPEQMQNYARSVVRAGETELRRAVEGERTPAGRRALLDEAHKLDPVLAEKVARQTSGKLFQGAKGAVDFATDGRAIIHAYEAADVSTAVHEIGHIFRKDLEGSDLATIEKWAGVENGKWETPHEETFARGFEEYLAEGKAPTPALARVFAKFKTWLIEIYRTLTGSPIDVNINDEVRAVFDRLLGAEKVTQEAAPAAKATLPEAPVAPPVLHNVGDIVKLPDGTQASIRAVRPDASLELDNGQVVSAASVQRVAAQENMFGEKPPTQQTTLLQEPDPRFPFGGYDQQAKGDLPPVEQAFEEAWPDLIQPLLDSMRDEALKRNGQPQFNLGGADDATQAAMRKYVSGVKQDLAGAKLQTVRYGEMQRDNALLNYSRRFGADKVVDAFVPYQFWTTRSMANWAMRAMDRPAWFANYARLRMASNTYTNNTPERMRGKIAIPAPYLPKWMGSSLYIDPWSTLFPPAQWQQPFDQMTKDQNTQTLNATRLLQEWASDGTSDDAQAQQALQAQSGPLWDKAVAEASLNQQAEISSPFDLSRIMFGPAWYLSTPLNLLGIKVPGISTGKSSDVGVLPITKTAQAAQAVTQGTWAEPIGDILGAFAKPEEWARKKLNLPQGGEFGDYYIDRQLANMVADGEASPEDAEMAMAQRTGPSFEAAQKRVSLEMAARIPLMMGAYTALHGGNAGEIAASNLTGLFGAQLLPAGELKYRGLTDKWNAAWDAYNAGDKTKVTQFFDDHPEYETYIARKKAPQDRLRTFLVGQVWDRYMALDKPNKRMVVNQMGSLFQDAFLNTETRNYDGLDIETLAMWSQMMGGLVPKTPETQGTTSTPQAQQTQLQGMPVGLDAQLNTYNQEKASRFSGIDELQNIYFAIPTADRKRFLIDHPTLKKYWDWRKDYITNKVPEIRPFVDSTYAQQIMVGQVPADATTRSLLTNYYSADYQSPFYTAADYLQGASSILKRQLQDYKLRHVTPGAGAMGELKKLWEEQGKPGGTLQVFLDEIIVPTLGQ